MTFLPYALLGLAALFVAVPLRWKYRDIQRERVAETDNREALARFQR